MAVELINSKDGSRSIESIEAGTGLRIGAGLIINLDNAPVEIDVNASYKFDTIPPAKNGSASFSSLPIDVLALYKKGNHRFGGGIAYHLSPTLKITTTLPDVPQGSFDYENTLGFIAEYAYQYSPHARFSLRYTKMTYKGTIELNERNADNIGAMMAFTF